MRAKSNTEPASAGIRTVRKHLSAVIIVLGLLWVIYIVTKDLPALLSDFKIASTSWLAYTVVAGTAALVLTAPIFQATLRDRGGVQTSYRYAARLLFVAQLLRHLPGRIWGVVYLVKQTRAEIPAAAMIRANLDVMVYSLSYSLLVAAVLSLGVLVDGRLGAAAGCAGLAISVLAMKYDWTGTVLRQALRLAPANTEKWREAFAAQLEMSWAAAFSTTGFYVLVWGLYLSVWWAFTRIFPGLGDVNIWLLCAAYSAAWAIGYVTMITPGGLGVREAGFIAMSTTLTTLPTLTFLAVFIRLWQILIEVIVFAVFSILKADTTIELRSPEKETA